MNCNVSIFFQNNKNKEIKIKDANSAVQSEAWKGFKNVEKSRLSVTDELGMAIKLIFNLHILNQFPPLRLCSKVLSKQIRIYYLYAIFGLISKDV